MSKISKHSDNSDDKWFDALEKSLDKIAVQPRSQTSLFDQINSIMNNKSKFNSVDHAVQDMMERSGLKTYLDKVKISETTKKNASKEDDIKVNPRDVKTSYEIGYQRGKRDKEINNVNTLASLFANDISTRSWVDYALGYGLGSQMSLDEKNKQFKEMLVTLDKVEKADSQEGVESLAQDSNDAFMKTGPVKKDVKVVPIVIKKYPQIQHTFENKITDSKGNKSVPALIQAVKAIHNSDVPDPKDWEDDNLIIFVSNLNLKAKKEHPEHKHNENNLGKSHRMTDSEIDSSNSDAFNALNTATFK